MLLKVENTWWGGEGQGSGDARDLIERYERQKAQAERLGATAPLARTFAAVLEDLRSLDGVEGGGRMMTTSEAAALMGMARKTIAAWASGSRFPGATKTSQAGEWRIPSSDVYALMTTGSAEQHTPVARLWRPADGEKTGKPAVLAGGSRLVRRSAGVR